MRNGPDCEEPAGGRRRFGYRRLQALRKRLENFIALRESEGGAGLER